ncbi:MAG: hypothetical protein ACKVZH_08710 [Blastocatellia bacterium]
MVEKEFLEKRRQVEINALNEWTSMLCGREGSAKYVLTLVSKADLWWSQHDEVMAYYEEGKYFQELNEAKDMHHIVLPYCSVIQMFYDEMETSGRFQDSDRKSAKAHLIDTLVGLAGKRQKF